MSLKSNNNDDMKQVVSDIVSITMSHIQDIAIKLKDMNITEENLKDKSPETIQKSVTLNNILTIINDCIHPAHELSKELYPDALEFINICIDNHKRAIEKKLISPICNCYCCKMKKPVKE